ncbi:MAG: lysine 5,6-aminomutase subunit alpha, partial [Actinomycetota bacterium]
MAKLILDKDMVKKARDYANRIASKVQNFIDKNTTTTIERATIRLLGVDGVNKDDVPLPNMVVDSFRDELGSGILYPFVNAMCFYNVNAQILSEMISKEKIDLKKVPSLQAEKVIAEINKLVKNACLVIKKRKNERYELIKKLGDPKKPWLYVIVATGNIYEDVVQAKAAVREGADVIAVIRSTAQSLLDYVPYGITTTGYGGTYATQANFKIMREALDEVSDETG